MHPKNIPFNFENKITTLQATCTESEKQVIRLWFFQTLHLQAWDNDQFKHSFSVCAIWVFSSPAVQQQEAFAPSLTRYGYFLVNLISKTGEMTLILLDITFVNLGRWPIQTLFSPICCLSIQQSATKQRETFAPSVIQSGEFWVYLIRETGNTTLIVSDITLSNLERRPIQTSFFPICCLSIQQLNGTSARKFRTICDALSPFTTGWW